MRNRSSFDANLICPEELESAMLSVAKKMIGCKAAVLIEETAHALGYSHCKEKIRTRLQYIYQRLINSEKITESPSGVVNI